jgi:archaellum component FlaF (FlaF/FlaG flagellin family)
MDDLLFILSSQIIVFLYNLYSKMYVQNLEVNTAFSSTVEKYMQIINVRVQIFSHAYQNKKC